MRSEEVVRRRMHSQRLWGPPMASPEDVVGWLAAMQSQEIALAEWAVAQRTRLVNKAAMDQAVANGTILRSHLLRPTWHFVLPADIRWLLELTRPRINALNAFSYRRFGLDEAVFAKTNAVIAAALDGGRQLTRKELASILHGAGITASGLHLAYVLMRAELDAVICSGAPRGRQQTYARLEDRVPSAPSLDRTAALAELTRRYFTSRGPATLRDYLRWSSLTAADGHEGLEMVGSLLQREVVDGRTYWFAPAAPGAVPPSPWVDLVQGYDECIMSYSESKDVLRLKGTTGRLLTGEAVFTHAILLDGRLLGHWRPVVGTSRVAVDAHFYRPLNAAENDAFEAAADRYGRFVGLPVVLKSQPESYVRRNASATISSAAA